MSTAELPTIIEPTDLGYFGESFRHEAGERTPPSSFHEYNDKDEAPLTIGNGPDVTYRDDDTEGLRIRTPRIDRIKQAEGVQGLLAAGHGFGVKTLTEESENEPIRCIFCGGSVFGQREWSCDCASTWSGCQCNQCLIRQQIESGRYRGVGRPPKVCKSTDCKRRLRSQQQRERRARERAEAG
jgi:hypothetical protein